MSPSPWAARIWSSQEGDCPYPPAGGILTNHRPDKTYFINKENQQHERQKQKEPVGFNPAEIFAALALLEKERGIPSPS